MYIKDSIVDNQQQTLMKGKLVIVVVITISPLDIIKVKLLFFVKTGWSMYT